VGNPDPNGAPATWSATRSGHRRSGQFVAFHAYRLPKANDLEEPIHRPTPLATSSGTERFAFFLTSRRPG
jgi:hypothetical protein